MAKMVLSHSINVNCTLYNRMYAKNTLDSKLLKITFKVATDKSFNLTDLIEKGEYLIKLLHKAAIVSVNDPILINMIEPKAGNTVHTFLEKAKKDMPAREWAPVGYTVPPETINGYHVILLGAEYVVTLEGFAEWMLDMTDDLGVTTVVVEDGSLHVEVSV